jgi:hypothetical protein
MTRNGKIARLPHQIRHKLNTRLQNGDLGKDLVDWLNSLPETQKLLAAEFNSHFISEQNLSEWRQGGYPEWQRQQEVRDRLESFIDLSASLEDDDDDGDKQSITDRLSRFLAIQLATETQLLLEQTTDPKERFRHICEAIRHLNALRKGDRAAAREAREVRDWKENIDQTEIAAINAEHEREMKDMKRRATSEIWDSLSRSALAQSFGGGPAAESAAEYIINIERAYRDEEPLPSRKPALTPANQTQSNPIKPDQT